MVWSAPPTFATDDQWKASDYNRYVRDNLLACETAVATTPGQMLITKGTNSVAMATVHTKTEESETLNSQEINFQYLGVTIKDMRSYGTMFIAIAAEMTAAHLSFKVFNEKETVIGPSSHWSATSGMYNNAPQRFTYTVDTDDSMYDIELWGRHDQSSGTTEMGQIHNIRLVVISK